MRLVEGRYVCKWCGADLDLPFDENETMQVITEHDGKTFHVIIVHGEERHRCEAGPNQAKPPGQTSPSRRA